MWPAHGMMRTMKSVLTKFVSKLRGSKPVTYREVWNSFSNLKEARQSIYNEADADAFDQGGRIDADFICRFLEPDAAVMDIGCGIGRVEQFLAPHCKSLVGVDISERMIEEARTRLSHHDNLSFRQNNGGDLSICETAEFDLVFSFFVLQHLEREDAFRYLEEVRRVVKPGGRALLQFPLVPSAYFDESFLADVTGRPPYHVARPRLYTPSESVFFLVKAGLFPQDLFLRGSESVFLCTPSRPDRAGFHKMARMVDPATAMRLWGECLPAPALATDGERLLELSDLASAAGDPIDGDGSLRLEALGERTVVLGDDAWTDYRVDIELQLDAPWEEDRFPDIGIGLRSYPSDGAVAGPYVQTTMGHAWIPRVRKGEWWDDLPFTSGRSLEASREPLRLTLVVDSDWLTLYDENGWVFTARTDRRHGPPFLRLVDTTVQVRAFQVSTLA